MNFEVSASKKGKASKRSELQNNKTGSAWNTLLQH